MTAVLVARASSISRLEHLVARLQEFAGGKLPGDQLVIPLETTTWSPRQAVQLQDDVLQASLDHGAAPIVTARAEQLIHGGPQSLLDLLERLASHDVHLLVEEQPWLSTALLGDQIQREVLAWVLRHYAHKWAEAKHRTALEARLQAAKDGERAPWVHGEMARPGEIRKVLALSKRGWSRRQVAANVGISKSQVQRIVENGEQLLDELEQLQEDGLT